MMRMVMAAVVAIAAACGEDTAPDPSCEVAMPHYFEAGCLFLVNGQPTRVEDATQFCKQEVAFAEFSGRCESEWRVLRLCLSGVRTTTGEAFDCDCEAEAAAAFACE